MAVIQTTDFEDQMPKPNQSIANTSITRLEASLTGWGRKIYLLIFLNISAPNKDIKLISGTYMQ